MNNKENKIVKIKNLSHRYSANWAIRDINLEINSIGVLGLLGSNGAGKSTTMNILCGALRQTEGDIFINNINLKDNPIEGKKHIGFLPQSPPLYLNLTVDEYLYHCADIRLMNKDEINDAITRVKDKCGLTHFSKRLIKSLSGGYKQRVGIAQSIIHNPPIVIMDEPTNGLDPNQVLQVRELIREISKERAVLISTHILTEVQELCDNIKMIEHGKMVFSGTKEEFNNYVAPSTLVVIMKNTPSDEIFLELKCITKIEHLTSNKTRIHFMSCDDIIYKIVDISIKNNWEIEEIFLEKKSLDTVFAKLSGKE